VPNIAEQLSHAPRLAGVRIDTDIDQGAEEQAEPAHIAAPDRDRGAAVAEPRLGPGRTVGQDLEDGRTEFGGWATRAAQESEHQPGGIGVSSAAGTRHKRRSASSLIMINWSGASTATTIAG
jgi:hypothetical protein